MVVISGGAKGVTYRIARALAPFRVRVVLLGRTEMDPAAASAPSAPRRPARINACTACLKGNRRRKRATSLRHSPAKNLAGPGNRPQRIAPLRLGAQGLLPLLRRGRSAQSGPDTGAGGKTVRPHRRHHPRGRSHQGQFHGVHDARGFQTRSWRSNSWGPGTSTVPPKNPACDFSSGLSSIVAIQGNVGQVNYCAANRSLAALLRSLPLSHEGLISKALMLPPIEGTGMADDPEVRALMERKGLKSAFVHADELAQMFCRELLMGPPQPSWVLLARTFPAVRGTRVESTVAAPGEAGCSADGVCFQPGELPMIGAVEKPWTSRRASLIAQRTFSQAVDLWIEDHKPFKFSSIPSSRGSWPWRPSSKRPTCSTRTWRCSACGAWRSRIFSQCPSDMQREARITCRRQERAGQEVRCDVQLASADISPSGRSLERWSTNYRGQVVLGPKRFSLPSLPDFGFRPRRWTPGPWSHLKFRPAMKRAPA